MRTMIDTTSTASAVLASDFSHSTADPDRHEWTEPKISHLMAAIGDTPVIITVDRSTGFTLVGARLIETRGAQSPGDNSRRVVIETRHGDGPDDTQRTGYRIRDLGETITPLPAPAREFTRGARWDALDAQREHNRAATTAVYAWMDENGGRDRDSGWYGALTVSSSTGKHMRHAYVTWTGQRECDRDARGSLPVNAREFRMHGGRASWEVNLTTGAVALTTSWDAPRGSGHCHCHCHT